MAFHKGIEEVDLDSFPIPEHSIGDPRSGDYYESPPDVHDGWPGSDDDPTDDLADSQGSDDRDPDAVVPCQFITGPAGSGKTYYIREKIKADPSYGQLCATTGIAAVNLDAITLNGVLKYFDTASLEENLVNGRLQMNLRKLRDAKFKYLIIDEISMLEARQLDLIWRGLEEINEDQPPARRLGIILTGDFLQLPPIGGKIQRAGRWVNAPAPFCFDAECWPNFTRNTIRLDKIWRQSDPGFLDAINLIREGNGPDGVVALKKAGVEFAPVANKRFDGTTIYPKNEMVDRFNELRLYDLKADPIILRVDRWGEQRSEWKNIPDKIRVRKGAIVMILANDTQGYTYVNGDLAEIEDYVPDRNAVQVKLMRTGQSVILHRIHRHVVKKERPSDGTRLWSGSGEVPDGPYQLDRGKGWAYGGILYHPIRLGYASTVHKTQGLSLDRVQVDVTGAFMGSPGMIYVAVSRARTAAGLRIVGSPEEMTARVKTEERVRRFL